MERMKKVLVMMVGTVILGSVLALAPVTVIASDGETRWTLNEARSGHTVTLLPDGRILVAGGYNESGILATAEMYDAASGVATVVTSSLATPRTGHKAVLLEDGWVLLVGGEGADGALDSAEAFDPSSETFVSVGPMNVPRLNHTVTLLPDGQVLVVGGNDGVVPLPWIEIFDPNSDTFIFLEAVLLEARESHTATLLKDGRVLVAGGRDAIGALATTEYVDPVALSVEPGPVLTEPRYGHTATRLMSGDVALVYGTDGTWALNTAEILAPDFNDVFMIVNDPNDPNSGRYNHVAVLLPQNGNLLLLGGYCESGVPDSSAELLNPLSYEFSPFTSLQNARAEFGAVADDGHIWAIGGAGPNEIPLADIETLQYATLVTDQIDYPPDSNVTFTGSGWLPGETVEILIEESDDVNSLTMLVAVADANGNILNQQFNVGPDNAGVSFLATATGTSSTQTAFANFFDPTPAPYITSLYPPYFTATDADVPLTIYGYYMDDGDNTVYISGPAPATDQTELSIQNVTPGGIAVTIPASIANQPGAYKIWVEQLREIYGCSYSKCGSHCCEWCRRCPSWFYCYWYCCGGSCPNCCYWDETYNSNSKTLTITPENQPPVAVCQDVTVSAGPGCTADASIDDGSYDPDGDPITLTQDPPGPYGLGGTTVTLTVTDDSGESDSCQATVTVIDTTPPTFTCPPDVIVSTDAGLCEATGVNLGTPQASDNCGVADVRNYAPAGFRKGDTVVTWTATDTSGNAATCSQTVTVVDNEPPVITITSPQDGVITNQDVVLSYTVSDNCSGPEDITVAGGQPLYTAEGNYTVTLTATDLAGNSATASVSFTIDKTPPTIVSSRTPAPNAYGWNNTDVTIQFSCSDALSGVESCTSDVILTGEGAGQSVTGIAVDLAGNTATAGEIINIDKTSPMISASPDRSPNANGWYNADVTVTFAATDALSGIVSVTAPIILLQEGANLSATGVATDQAGNEATFTLDGINIDKTCPAANPGGPYEGLEGLAILFVGSPSDNLSGIASCEWDLDNDGQFDDGTGLNPQYTWYDDYSGIVGLKVTDLAGNVSIQTTPVTVGNVAPIVDAGTDRTADEGSTVSFNGSFTDPGTADTHTYSWDFGDPFDITPASGTLTPTHTYADDGIYTVTLTVTDDDGGMGTDTCTVTVNNVAPTVVAGLDRTAECCDDVLFSGSFSDPGADTHTIKWDFGDESTAAGTLTPTHKYCDIGVYTVTLTVTDDDAGVGEDTLTVTVQDTTPPVISLNGDASITLECGIDSYTEEGATAMDICDDDVPVIVGGDTVDTSTCGTYEVTYDATDDSGNSAAQVTRTVIVEDTIPPEFSLSVEPDVLWPPNHKMVLITPSWTVSDNCDESLDVTLISITMNEGDEINAFDPMYDNTQGDGHTVGDIQVDSDGIWLRAERSGTGGGRVYIITYQAADDSGNVTLGGTTVTVPHDQD